MSRPRTVSATQKRTLVIQSTLQNTSVFSEVVRYADLLGEEARGWCAEDLAGERGTVSRPTEGSEEDRWGCSPLLLKSSSER